MPVATDEKHVGQIGAALKRLDKSATKWRHVFPEKGGYLARIKEAPPQVHAAFDSKIDQWLVTLSWCQPTTPARICGCRRVCAGTWLETSEAAGDTAKR